MASVPFTPRPPVVSTLLIPMDVLQSSYSEKMTKLTTLLTIWLLPGLQIPSKILLESTFTLSIPAASVLVPVPVILGLVSASTQPFLLSVFHIRNKKTTVLCPQTPKESAFQIMNQLTPNHLPCTHYLESLSAFPCSTNEIQTPPMLHQALWGLAPVVAPPPPHSGHTRPHFSCFQTFKEVLLLPWNLWTRCSYH